MIGAEPQLLSTLPLPAVCRNGQITQCDGCVAVDQLKSCLKCPDCCGEQAAILQHVIKLVDQRHIPRGREFDAFYTWWMYAAIHSTAAVIQGILWGNLDRSVEDVVCGWFFEIFALVKLLRSL